MARNVEKVCTQSAEGGPSILTGRPCLAASYAAIAAANEALASRMLAIGSLPVCRQSMRWAGGNGAGGANDGASAARSNTQSAAPAASTARPGDLKNCSPISPREPTASKRTTLFCFGEGPVVRGALIVHDASSV